MADGVGLEPTCSRLTAERDEPVCATRQYNLASSMPSWISAWQFAHTRIHFDSSSTTFSHDTLARLRANSFSPE